MSDSVNHPKHYNKHPSGIECIEIVRHMNFNLGNAVKYIWRAGLKSKDPIEDLKKAIFYLNDEINRIQTDKINKTIDSLPKEEQLLIPFPPIPDKYQVPQRKES